MANNAAWAGLGQAIGAGGDAYAKAKAAKMAAERQSQMDAQAAERQGVMDSRYAQEQATKQNQFDQNMAMEGKKLDAMQQAKQAAQAEKAAKKAQGRPLSVNTAEELGDRLAIPSELSKNAADVKGSGLLSPWNAIATKIPFAFTERKDVASKVGSIRKLAARAIEGARLTDSDMEYYTKNLPSETDTPQEFENKTKNLVGLLSRATGSRLDSFQKAGFDVSGYESDRANLKELGKQTGETGTRTDPRIEMAKQALQDPEATPEEKAQAQKLLGM